LLISAFLTAVYMLTILLRAYFPKIDYDHKAIRDFKDPSWLMCLPFVIFSAAMIVLSFTAPQLMGVFDSISGLMK
jgi:multicomponent Na+:H+ antiporter subunit D